MGTSTIVRVQRAYACAADSVYDAWLEPETARRFLFATPPRGQVVQCEIEPGVNGSFTIVDRRPLEGDSSVMDMKHVGRFLQLDRPRRIAFNFSLPDFQDSPSTVVVDIEPLGDGCELTLRHDLGPGESAREMHGPAEAGWTQMLANLDAVLKRD